MAKHAMEAAQVIARQAVTDWRGRMAPVAEDLYKQAVARFVEIANGFVRAVADSENPALVGLPGSFDPNLAFRTKAHFYFTELLTLASPKFTTRLATIHTRGSDLGREEGRQGVPEPPAHLEQRASLE